MLQVADTYGEVNIPIPLFGGTKMISRVMSINDLANNAVVRQQFDFSCGSSALATLLNISFGEHLNEDDIIPIILEGKNVDDLAEIEKKGIR